MVKHFKVTYYYSEAYCIHGTKNEVTVTFDHMPNEEEVLDYFVEHEIEPCKQIIQIESIEESI